MGIFEKEFKKKDRKKNKKQKPEPKPYKYREPKILVGKASNSEPTPLFMRRWCITLKFTSARTVWKKGKILFMW